MGFEIVRREDCGPPTGDRQTMFAKLEKDLVKQVGRHSELMICHHH